jgi:hypothetical protein
MRQVHPEVDAAYARVRARQPPRAPPAGPPEIETVLADVGRELQGLLPAEDLVRHILNDVWLRMILGPLLSEHCVAVPEGPVRAVDLYDILQKPGRFVGMVRGGVLERVVDRHELATQIATTVVREQFAT